MGIAVIGTHVCRMHGGTGPARRWAGKGNKPIRKPHSDKQAKKRYLNACAVSDHLNDVVLRYPHALDNWTEKDGLAARAKILLEHMNRDLK